MTMAHLGGLESKAIIKGYKRSLRRQNCEKIIIFIPEASGYQKSLKFLGKKVVFQPISAVSKRNKFNWGKIISLHGRTGCFVTKFKKPISPKNFASKVLVMPFPNKS